MGQDAPTNSVENWRGRTRPTATSRRETTMTDNAPKGGAHPIDAHKTHEIVVNGRPRSVEDEELSYGDLVKLALDPVPSGPNVEITVSYRDGAGRPSDGLLVQGGKVKVRDGTVIIVSHSDKS